MDAFAAHRSRLLALGYRLLGSRSEAEDLVQETHVRWLSRGVTEAQHAGAWLERTLTNLCLDERRSARARRETYVGVWLPEPVRSDDPCLGPKVDAESVSLAFLTLLETLSPLERAVYVLAEAFDYSPAELAELLERDAAAVRQVLHRAREHVREGRPRFTADRELHRQVLERFFAAVLTGEVAAVEALLAKDATVRSDGGGKVRAALNVVTGAERVARLMLGVAQKSPPGVTFDWGEVNSAPALIGRTAEGEPVSVTQLETDGVVIQSVLVVVNPEKLRGLLS